VSLLTLASVLAINLVPIETPAAPKLNIDNIPAHWQYVRYKWLNKNPFNTMYWAVMGMAAELCSGLLLMMYSCNKKPGISMHVVACNSNFIKTGLGKITFTCEDGELIANKVQECMANKSAATIDCVTIAHNEKGDLVANFVFTWSIKGRK